MGDWIRFNGASILAVGPDEESVLPKSVDEHVAETTHTGVQPTANRTTLNGERSWWQWNMLPIGDGGDATEIIQTLDDRKLSMKAEARRLRREHAGKGIDGPTGEAVKSGLNALTQAKTAHDDVTITKHYPVPLQFKDDDAAFNDAQMDTYIADLATMLEVCSKRGTELYQAIGGTSTGAMTHDELDVIEADMNTIASPYPPVDLTAPGGWPPDPTP